MADISIPRPESITPAGNTGGQDSPRHDQQPRRRPRPNPDPATPVAPDESHDESSNHQVDELA